MKTSREAGFTLIEIMIVMAIIVTLVGLVSVGVPKILEHQDKLKCQNNLKEIGQLLITRRSDKGWPSDRGAGFLLRSFLEETELQKNPEVYICPGDDAHAFKDLSSEDYRDELLKLLEKYDGNKPENRMNSALPENMISYAGRLRAVPKEGNDKVPLACDRQGEFGEEMHHKGGINVLYEGGGVSFRERDYFDIADDTETITIGASGKLEDLGYQPDGR